LAQGFVGISSQLDALALKMNGDPSPSDRQKDLAQRLDLAQRMARYSLTEARRSVMDLRASELTDSDLPTALTAAARTWAAGSTAAVEIQVTGAHRPLPEDVEQNALRIAQEAVANALKHARAQRIWIELHLEPHELLLTVRDDGRGFDLSGAFVSVGGHFGLLGMRERAERLGGQMDVASEPGAGTETKVRIPLPAETGVQTARHRFGKLIRTWPVRF
jgi:signal transduction histidine kinase